MPPSPSEQIALLSLLHRAMAAPIGIVLTVSDPDRARRELGEVRRASGDPDLGLLSFRTSPLSPESELWIVRLGERSAAAPPPPKDDLR